MPKILLDATIGTIISIALYLATLPAVNKQRQLVSNGLGPLNPYQIVYSISSCLIWLVYGFMINNWYVMIERVCGLSLYLFYALSCLGLMAINWSKMNVTFGNADGLQKEMLLADIRAISVVQYAIVLIVVVWVTVFALIFNAYGLDPSVLGQICSINSIGYNIVKTPHIYIIARSKNVSTIILPLLFMDSLAAAAWLMYGIGIKNNNFVYPNLVGLTYSFTYLTLYLLHRNNVPDLSAFGSEVAIDTEAGKVGFVRNSSRSRAGSSFDPYRATSNSYASSDKDASAFGDRSRSGTIDRSRSGTIDRSQHSRSGTAEDKDLEPQVDDVMFPMQNMPINDPEEDGSTRVGFVAALDNVMETLVNIGRSRAYTILIDPVAAEEIAHVERLNEQLVPELAGDVCSFCSSPVLVDAKFCSTCGTPIKGGTAEVYQMQSGGDYSSLLSLAQPPEDSPIKLNPTFDPDTHVSTGLPLMPIEEERPSMFSAEIETEGEDPKEV